MNTRSARLPDITASQWLPIVFTLSRDNECDLLLSNATLPGEGISYVAIEPDRELLIDPSTTRDQIDRFAFSDDRPTIGFLSYNYGFPLNRVASGKDSHFPLGHLKKYRALVTYDQLAGSIDVESNDDSLRQRIRQLICDSHGAMSYEFPPLRDPVHLETSLTKVQYISRVEQTLEHIRAGDIYQLSLSQRYSVRLSAPPNADTILALFHHYPAPYYAYFASGHHRIMSTSPECFLRVRDGQVQSRPIKGTLHFDTYRPELTEQLVSSLKEDAELSMIVDLIRNDISRNCEYGSVVVRDHKSVFAVDRLLQMCSNVEGRLRSDRTCIDLLLDAFPGGSVTGCPKKRAMELIDQLEPHRRDIYCGSFVIIKDRSTMDSSIAIRTGYHDNTTDTFHFFAGSGIVVESDPAAEYAETVAKADKFLTMFGISDQA